MSDEQRFWPDLPTLAIEMEQLREQRYRDPTVRFLLPDRALPPARAPIVRVYPQQPQDVRRDHLESE